MLEISWKLPTPTSPGMTISHYIFFDLIETKDKEIEDWNKSCIFDKLFYIVLIHPKVWEYVLYIPSSFSKETQNKRKYVELVLRYGRMKLKEKFSAPILVYLSYTRLLLLPWCQYQRNREPRLLWKQETKMHSAYSRKVLLGVTIPKNF